ncbi:uncharacterized protein LOC124158386 [Ischnura elegans]|uniref:uncharacterized protein LOC124158386 n=1 Tax=Ischnura elegans TaxID=197161 RepID=UPI001ED8AF09|nr:uncharacterized protein LOC124158386 [Ischnura elegans]
MAVLDSCCKCISLRTGTLIAGVLGIVISIITLIVVLVTEVNLKTIVMDSLPPTVVKIILAINLAMTVLISILLILGVIKRNSFMMLPWVALAILLAIGLAVSVIYTAVNFYIHEDAFNGTLWLVCGLITVAFYVYMWLVVFSFYQLVKDGGALGGYAKPPYRG